VVASIVVGTLVPGEASAQEEAPVPPKGAVTEDAAEAEEAGPEPERFELSLGVAPTLGGLLGLTGTGALGGLQGAGLVPIALDVGFPLGSRALLTVGGSFQYTEASGVYSVGLQLPLSVLCYFDRPRAGAFVPLLRVLARASFTETGVPGLGSFDMLALGAGARGGLTYFFADALALRLELGAGVDASFTEGWTNVTVDLESAITLVLRV
jgi:hypothetical protein